MNCTDVQDLMDSYVLGQVSPKESVQIHAHLETCEECRDWYDEVLEMKSLFSMRSPVAELNLVDRVVERLQSEHVGLPTASQMGKELNPASERSSRDGEVRVERGFALPRRTVFLHYGLAASVAIALLELGVFNHLGGLSHQGAILSTHLNNLMRVFTGFQL